MCLGALKLIRVSSMLFMAVACASSAFAQTSTTFGGEATALAGTVAGIPLNLAGTGPVDPSGGARNNSLVCYPGGSQCYLGLPDPTAGLLSVQLLNATTVARGHQSYADASVAKLHLRVHGVLIKADFIKAIAKKVCEPELPPEEIIPESVGRAEFDELTIEGMPVAVTGLPNQTIAIPSPFGGTITIVINEQTTSGGGITVRALRIKAAKVLGLVAASDVSVAKTHADMDCGVPECFAEKVTGGGFVYPTPNGGKGTFAASGRQLSDWGHFLFIDHATGTKIKATSQTTEFVTIDGDGVALISGMAQINGQGSYPFTAQLQDNGEPGTDDRFGLIVGSDEIIPFQKIAGGNIQFHKPRHGECPVPDPDPESPVPE